MISFIAALTKDRVIGHNGQLPWHLPADLKHFKALTLGKTVVMGRRTFDSIGHPLPDRENWILSRNTALRIPGCKMFYRFEDLWTALEPFSLFVRKPEGERRCCTTEIAVIGGAELFHSLLPLADKLYLTQVDAAIPGDTHFPAWSKVEWQRTAAEARPADDQNPYACTFETWERGSTIRT